MDETAVPLEIEELTSELLHAFAAASEEGARGLHVQLTVPREAGFEWIDPQHDGHPVYLPTRIKWSAMRYPGDPMEDGGPAAVFAIDAQGSVPPENLVSTIALRLVEAGIRWGLVRHARLGEPLDDLPLLPERFETVAAAAITGD